MKKKTGVDGEIVEVKQGNTELSASCSSSTNQNKQAVLEESQVRLVDTEKDIAHE